MISYSVVVAVAKDAERSGGAVGRRIRSLREARGLSLRELAARSDVSAPMLSQVERGDASPTLALAGRIAGGLGLTLSQLLRLDEGGYVDVVRRGDRAEHRAAGHVWRDLTPALPGQRAMVSGHTLESRARTGGGDGPMHEPGSRETIVVVAGRVTLHLDEDVHELAEGDAVTFDADLAHYLENPGRSAARFVAVVTSGLRTA